MKECTRSIARQGGLASLPQGIVRIQRKRHDGFVRVMYESHSLRKEKEKDMKKIILGVILTAGAVLAQSTGTAPVTSGTAAPANSGTKSSAPATSAPATKAPVKKHSKTNKPAATNSNAAAKPATPAAPATPASK
jgi:hypothetical protein